MSERAAERKPGQRGRKVATVAVLGLLAMGGLSACHTDAGTAVYVGNDRITQAYVNDTVNSVSAAKLAAVNITVPQAKTLVAQYAAFSALASQYAKKKGLTTPPPDTSEVSGIASALSVSADKIASNPFIKVIAQGDAWSNFLLSKTPASAGTDADLRQIYDDLLQNGLPATTSYASIKSELAQALPTAGTANTLRNDLDAEAKNIGVSVNPRYAGACIEPKCDGLTFPLAAIQNGSGGSVPVALVNMGGTATPAVFDVPVPVPTETAPAQQ